MSADKLDSRKLVRARPKLPEYLPEDAKCCAKFVQGYQRKGETVVDLADKYFDAVRCMHCGASHGIQHGVFDVNHGGYLALAYLDLDEGEAVTNG